MRFLFIKGFAILLLCPLIVPACASPKPPSLEEQAFAMLAVLKDAIEAKDKDAVMELLSPSFRHPEIGGRDDAYAIMSLALESGYQGVLLLDSMAVKYSFNKETGNAELFPLSLKGQGQVFMVSLILTPASHGAGWQILTFELEPA